MGGQKGVALFYKYLEQHCTVYMAASTDNNSSKEERYFPFLYNNKRISYNLLYLKKLKNIIKEKGIDVIIVEHSYPFFLGYFLRKITGVPVVIHSHNLEGERFKQMGKWWWRWYTIYERWALKNADSCFFISREDQEKAIAQFHLKEKNCKVLTYGIEENAGSLYSSLPILKKNKNEKWLFFNGTLDYKPNKDAINFLICTLDALLQERAFNYKLIISGTNLSPFLKEKIENNNRFLFVGFIDDLLPYYQCADLFLNPVNNNSGIKTKVLEAIANGCTVISFAAGASGINKNVCGEKLIIVPDGDGEEMANEIISHSSQERKDTPDAFFNCYSWKNITKSAAQELASLITKNA